MRIVFYWKKENKKKFDAMDSMYAMITTHVDDLAVMSITTWLDERYNRFVKRFQKVTRQQLPFVITAVVTTARLVMVLR